MSREKAFKQYQLDTDSANDNKQPTTRLGEESVAETMDGGPEIYDEIRKYRGLRGLTDEQVRNLICLLDRFDLPMEALEGPRRDVRTAVTAHMTPEFLHQFRELAAHYGLSPSNLARVVLKGWANSSKDLRSSEDPRSAD